MDVSIPRRSGFSLSRAYIHYVDVFGTGRSGISVYDLFQAFADITEMRKAWSDAMRTAGVDCLVFPGVPLPAFPHGLTGKLTAPISYMFIANLLDWPSGTLPVTTIQDHEQHYSMEDLPSDQRDDYVEIAAKVMENSAGLPLSVSVLAPAFRDETCLRVMKEVERLVDFQAEPSAYQRASI